MSELICKDGRSRRRKYEWDGMQVGEILEFKKTTTVKVHGSFKHWNQKQGGGMRISTWTEGETVFAQRVE